MTHAAHPVPRASRSLDELVGGLQSVMRLHDNSIAKTIAWLRRECASHNLYVGVERLSPADSARRTASGAVVTRAGINLDLGAALAELERAEREGCIGRVIICRTNRTPVAQNATLERECNGVVLLPSDGWRILALPPRAFTAAARPFDMSHYDVYVAEDGTIVTLYALPAPFARRLGTPAGAWAIATTHAYDTSELSWCGNQTYADVLFRALSAYPAFVDAAGLQLVDGRIIMTKIDPAKSYTIGFRSFRFHPKVDSDLDREKVWQILHAHTKGGDGAPRANYSAGLPALPVQVRVPSHCSTTSPDDATATEDTVTNLVALCDHSLDNLRQPDAAPCFGFILRARRPDCPAPDVLLESALLQQVRELMYLRPAQQAEERLLEEPPAVWRAYMTFRAILSGKTDQYIRVYGARADVGRMANWLHLVEERVLDCLRQQTLSSDAKNARLHAVAKTLANEFVRRHANVNTLLDDGRALVHDYIYSHEHNLLYSLAWVAS